LPSLLVDWQNRKFRHRTCFFIVVFTIHLLRSKLLVRNFRNNKLFLHFLEFVHFDINYLWWSTISSEKTNCLLSSIHVCDKSCQRLIHAVSNLKFALNLTHLIDSEDWYTLLFWWFYKPQCLIHKKSSCVVVEKNIMNHDFITLSIAVCSSVVTINRFFSLQEIKNTTIAMQIPASFLFS
jgi:hypothetical protein